MVDTSEPPVARACQLPLLSADELFDLPGDQMRRIEALRSPRRVGPGRPPGAKNRSTIEWQRYLLAKYRSPLEVMAEIMSRPVHDLADEVGCTRYEALKLQVHAAAASFITNGAIRGTEHRSIRNITIISTSPLPRFNRSPACL